MPNLTRTLTVTSGSDQSPIVDFTEWVDWEATELAMAAKRGDGTASTILFRDEDGVIHDFVGSGKFLFGHNVIRVTVGSNNLYRGRIADIDFFRGRQVAFRAREISVIGEDYNSDLDGIVVHNWVRGQETDKERVQGLAASYLSGNPRITTSLNGSNYISSSNTPALAAKTYFAVTPRDILREIADDVDKNFFVTVDGELFWDGWDSTAYPSLLTISDEEPPIPALTFSPGDPHGKRFVREHLSALRVYYGPDQEADTVRVTNTSHVERDYWEGVWYDDVAESPTQAENRATKKLDYYTKAEVTFTCAIGPMTGDQVYMIKAGQTIRVRARAALGGRDAAGNYQGSAFITRRITEVRWSFPAVDAYICTLELERPRTIGLPRGNPPGPEPPGEGTITPASCSLAVGLMEAIATPNGDFETGTGANWTGENVQPAAAGASGSWMSHDVGVGAGGWEYTGWTGLTFTAGTTYVVRMLLMSGNGAGAVATFGLYSGSTVTDGTQLTGGGGGLTLDAASFIENCIEWTPSADRTGVRFAFSRSASGTIGTDELKLYTGIITEAADPPPAADDDTGSIGTDNGCYANCDHQHPVSQHADLLGLTADDHLYVRDRAGGEEAISVIAATGATETIDLASANVHDLTLTANCTFTLSAVTSGVACSATLLLRQDGTGSRTVTWPGSVAWVGGAAPTLSTAAAAVDIITLFTLNGGTTWYGAMVGAGGAGGAPTTADYLVGTAQGGLSAEIVVGTTPGGELGNTWASPTVDATHSGSTHSAATDTHIADTSAAHVASSIGFTPNGSIAATDVQAAIQEVRDEAGGGSVLVGCRAYNSTTQSINSGSATVVTFDTEEYDTDTLHSTASNTSRFVANATAKWRVTVGVAWDTNSSNNRYLFLRTGGSTVVRGALDERTASPGRTAQVVTADIAISSGDYVEAIVFQDSGGARNLGDAADVTYQSALSFVKIG